MTGDAIYRRLLLAMAIEAIAHRQVHGADSYGLLRQVAVALGARHASPNVRCVVELHMRRGLEPVDALPGDVFTSRQVSRDLLDFRLVGRDDLVAGHAEIDAGNARVRPLVDSRMAIRTLHAVR